MESTKTEVFRATTSSWRFGVTRMEADRTTEKSVWINGRRVARESDGTRIFDDFESAKGWLVSWCERQIDATKRRLADQEKALATADELLQRDVETKTERWY